MSVYSFITNPWRYAEASDQTVRTLYPLARTIQIDGKLTNLSDAEAVKTEIFNLVKSQRFRFEVVVSGVDIVTPNSFDGAPLCATLSSDRFGLQAGRLVLIPDFTINLNKGETTLRCWG